MKFETELKSFSEVFTSFLFSLFLCWQLSTSRCFFTSPNWVLSLQYTKDISKRKRDVILKNVKRHVKRCKRDSVKLNFKFEKQLTLNRKHVSKQTKLKRRQSLKQFKQRRKHGILECEKDNYERENMTK